MTKKRIGDLAIFSGSPTFAEPLHVGRPNIPDRKRLIECVNDILDRRWLTNRGVYVKNFEQKIADMIGAKNCVCMCNGTVALEIAIRALGLNGEVIVPSFTFIATAHALQWQQITPVFCDIDPITYNIDPVRIEQLITPRTTGIIGVHLWGRPCEIDTLRGIAEKHNLKLLFDAAHAFGCSYAGKMIGSFGNAEVYSFHATKFLNTFEGGAVVTNDDELADRMRLMKNFGFSGYDNVIYIGTNGKMNEVSAAMGLTSLENMEGFIAVNYANYRQYRNELGDIAGIHFMQYNEDERNNFQYIILKIDEQTTHISRDQLVAVLHEENVLARRYFYPGSHKMEPYRSYFPNAGLLLPVTERIVQQIMSLPTGTAVGHKEISSICDIIRFVVNHAPEIVERLNS
jgi:dTDP-4-amino-4,6-dideoxygalactose transaminase